MRFFHRLLSLSLCGILMLGMPGLIWAQSPKPEPEAAVGQEVKSEPEAAVGQEAKPESETAAIQASDSEPQPEAPASQTSDSEPQPEAPASQTSDSKPQPEAPASQTSDSEPQPEAVYYQSPNPVTHVYLPYGGGFDDFKAAMGGWAQDLYPGGDPYADPMPFTYLGDDADGAGFASLLHDAVQQNQSEFSYPITYGVDRNLWADQPEKLDQWDSGLIKAPEDDAVTVHLRPADLCVTYHSDPAAPIPTVWANRDEPFQDLRPSLTDYDSLVQTDSLYDPTELDFSIQWDEQSYLEGMKSGADQFYVTGTYIGLYRNGPGEPVYDLYQRGLLQAQGLAKALIRVNSSEPQFYYNPYFPRFNRYKNIYQFQINIAPGVDFDRACLPATAVLNPFEGDPQDELDFGLEWNREEYEAGLVSGAESFTVSGAYALNPEWPQNLQDRWQSGAMKVLNDPSDVPSNDLSNVTPSPELTVNVLKEGLPFTVGMEYRMTPTFDQEDGKPISAPPASQSGVNSQVTGASQDAGGLIPVFTFPWPNGASKVTAAVSFDQDTWYQEDVEWSNEYEWNKAEWHFVHVDENGKLIAIPRNDPFPFYCKLMVTGSSFAGETQVMKVSPNRDGSWEMAPDQGGDHGGGGQGEHDRPGKDDPVQEPNPWPGSDREPLPSPETQPDREHQLSPERDQNPGSSSESDRRPEPETPSVSGSVPSQESGNLSFQSLPLSALAAQAASVPAAASENRSPSLKAAVGEPTHGAAPHSRTSQTGGSLSSQPGPLGPDSMSVDQPESDQKSVSLPESDLEFVAQSHPDSETAVTSQPSPTPHAWRIPGFAAAAAATAAVILCGAVWFSRLKKRK